MGVGRLVGAVAGAGVVLLSGRPASAQTVTGTGSQTVHFRVIAHRGARVTSPPDPLVPGRARAAVASAGYAIATNAKNDKITASLDRALPSGMALAIVLAAPTGANAGGSRQLATVATDLVTDIPAATVAQLPISYRLSTDGPARSPALARTVTFTIVAGP